MTKSAERGNGSAGDGSSSSSLAAAFERLSPTVHGSVLATGVFIFFGTHNYLQEAIMRVPGFASGGLMLGYFEVLGVAVCSCLERGVWRREHGRVAPLSSYPLLTILLMGSSSLSNLSLNFINFPTKVVFRSCKLIPTMILASIWHHKTFAAVEYACAVAICAGLVLFAAADWQTAPSFHPIGLCLVAASVVCDALLPNAQEKLFRSGASRLEVTFYTNVFTLAAYTISTLASGDLIYCLRLIADSSQLTLYFGVYTFIAYVAISCHMAIVQRFGGVAAVLVATVRKGMTLVLSFLLFPKAYSAMYPGGATLVLGSLLVHGLYKSSKKPKASDHDQRANSTGSNANARQHAPIQRRKSHDSGYDLQNKSDEENLLDERHNTGIVQLGNGNDKRQR